MEVRDLVASYIPTHYMMQLATVGNGQPWCCTVYYVNDDELNLYWLSLPSRRHSKEIRADNKVTAAIPINFKNDEKVVGIQIQGIAEELKSSDEFRDVADKYATKFNRTKKWVDDFCNNKTDHKLYKLSPKQFVIFDEINFPDQSRQEYTVS